MIIDKFEGATIRAAGLFPSARHDWMRFHAHDVPCPRSRGVGIGGHNLSVDCTGVLLWKSGSDHKELQCDHCKTTFVVKPRVKLALKKDVCA